MDSGSDEASWLGRLADAIGALATRELHAEVTEQDDTHAISDAVTPQTTLGLPFWRSHQRTWRWLAPLTLAFNAAGEQAEVALNWPVELPLTDVALPGGHEEEISIGGHTGLYLDRPLISGHGVRLRPMLHWIPRPLRGSGWVAEGVFAPTLGRDLRLRVGDDAAVAELGSLLVERARGGRYVSPELARDTLASLGAEVDAGARDTDQIAHALRATFADRTAAADEQGILWPRRTAAEINRRFGSDEVMAELVFARLAKLQPDRANDESWAEEFARRVSLAAEAAITAIALGWANVRSVIGPNEAGMTLARIEQESRVCFIGFRGLGVIRGRRDLRELEAGWRYTLCPVQTPEAEDIGLVRYTALGASPVAAQAARRDERLVEWLDLSASAALIPFVNHDDPARASIGSKNLKQAVPVEGAQPPLVATGWEKVLGLAAGTVRVPEEIGKAKVLKVGPDRVLLQPPNAEATSVRYGTPAPGRSTVENRWEPCVEVGQTVRAGHILAHAPDVQVLKDGAAGEAEAELCLGVNALVALTPWHGLNHEDGIVVSESFAARMTSTHLVQLNVLAADAGIYWHVSPPREGEERSVEAGDKLLTVEFAGGRDSVIKAPVSGQLVRQFRDHDAQLLKLTLRVERRLAIGDKLSNRHQGKGVISAILPDGKMPVVADGKLQGTQVDVILNPVGVLRRLNIGQLWEMHYGLAALLDDGTQVTVGRTADPEQVVASLKSDAPLGRLPLTLGGEPLGDIVVGPQYILKLNHLAADKLSVRGDSAAISLVNGQPTQSTSYDEDHWVGSAQRLGEMEVWALEASGADVVLADALNERSAVPEWARDKPRASLRSVQAHLAVAGLDLAVTGEDPTPFQQVDRAKVTSLSTRWRRTMTWTDSLGDAHEVLVSSGEDLDWRQLGRATKRQQWLGRPGNRPEKFAYLSSMIQAGMDETALNKALGIRKGKTLASWRDDKEDPEFAALLDTLAGRASTADLGDESAHRLPSREVVEPWEESSGDDRVALLYRVESPDVADALDARVAAIQNARAGGTKEAGAGQRPDEAGERQETNENRSLAEREIPRLVIPLPQPVPHPWGRGLPWIKWVPVLPPAYRMRNPGGPRGLDRLYLDLADRLVAYEYELRADDARAVSRSAQAWLRVQEAVYAILGEPPDPGRAARKDDSILARLTGKRGLLRRYLIGQAVTGSARSVMVPNWSLAADEVGLPKRMADGLGLRTDPELARSEPDTERVVLINRQPSLHPYSVVALRYVSVDGDAVQVHPLTLKGLAGDFDGDTIAVHRPSSPAARQNAWETLSPRVRLRSSANGRVLAKFDLDITLGLQRAWQQGQLGDRLPTLDTNLAVAEPGRKTKVDPIFAKALPGALKDLVDGMLGHRAPDADSGELVLHELSDLEKLGLTSAVGWSIGALDLLPAPGDVTPGEDEPVPTELRPPLSEAIAADVAGKEASRKQLLRARGVVPAPHPATTDVDVKGNFLLGLETDEYFGTSAGALDSLATKKLTTPQAGALTKTLVEIGDPVVISTDACGLHKNASPSSDEPRPGGIQRYSPLTCEDEHGICQACYGEDPGTGQAPIVGARIGVLAATLIGERSTELSMKAFHGSNVGGSLAVAGDIEELRAIFGQGRASIFAALKKDGSRRKPRDLLRFLDAQAGRMQKAGSDLTRREQTQRRRALAIQRLKDPDSRAVALAPVVDRAVRVLKNDVKPVHVQVLLRQLIDTYTDLGALASQAPQGQTSLLACAQRRGRTRFEVATSRGKVDWLLTEDDQDTAVSGVRSRLAAGSVPVLGPKPADAPGVQK